MQAVGPTGFKDVPEAVLHGLKQPFANTAFSDAFGSVVIGLLDEWFLLCVLLRSKSA